LKINVVIEQESKGLEVLDWFYAYRQSQCQKNSYKSDIDIIFSDDCKSDCINLLYSYQCHYLYHNIKDFDIVLLDNAGEALEVSTPFIKEVVEDYPHVYMLSGAFVTDDHPYKHKIIPYCHILDTFRRCYTDGFYPNFYELSQYKTKEKTKNFCFINGQNRRHRYYFSELLLSHCPFVNHHSKHTNVMETLECQFESPEDEKFRMFVNQEITVLKEKTHKFEYYSRSIPCGIDNKYGNVVPGMFLLPEYYDYHCVIFPETCWVNNQFFMTEKVFKCFISECLPLPIAGANTAKLYNKYGFHTVLDLVPDELQQVDSEMNHIQRYHGIIECIKWLNDNSDVLSSERAEKMLKTNKNNLYSSALNTEGVIIIDKILSRFR
tara:strand:- start:23135 stop:24268 length:1134 start_codon:yes stop_codon:yes gene_type:complete